MAQELTHVAEGGDHLSIRAEVPGVKPEKIDIKCEDGVLDLTIPLPPKQQRKVVHVPANSSEKKE